MGGEDWRQPASSSGAPATASDQAGQGVGRLEIARCSLLGALFAERGEVLEEGIAITFAGKCGNFCQRKLPAGMVWSGESVVQGEVCRVACDVWR